MGRHLWISRNLKSSYARDPRVGRMADQMYIKADSRLETQCWVYRACSYSYFINNKPKSKLLFWLTSAFHPKFTILNLQAPSKPHCRVHRLSCRHEATVNRKSWECSWTHDNKWQILFPEVPSILKQSHALLQRKFFNRKLACSYTWLSAFSYRRQCRRGCKLVPTPNHNSNFPVDLFSCKLLKCRPFSGYIYVCIPKLQIRLLASTGGMLESRCRCQNSIVAWEKEQCVWEKFTLLST